MVFGLLLTEFVRGIPRALRERDPVLALASEARRSFRSLGWPAIRFAAILVAILSFRLMTLGTYPLVDSTEGRYANIAREMLALDNWIVPHLQPDVPFWGKPPLSFWATAISFRVLGLNEFAARLPGFVFSLGALALLFGLMRAVYGWMSALQAGIVLATCGLYFVMSAGVLTDPSLLFCVTIAMVAFAMAVIVRRHQRVAGYLFFAGLGLGVLAKGLVGIILPGVAITLWLLIYGGLPSLRRLPWKWGIPLFLLIAVPWHLAAEVRSPGFLNYYIVGEHFLRFVDKGWSGDLYGNPHEEPKGMIWLFALVATMPWSLIALVAVHKLRKYARRIADPLVGFAVLWLLSPLLFFSLSDNVIITYMLPSLPAFALCFERLITFCLHSQTRPALVETPKRTFSWNSLAVAGLGFSLIANVGMIIFAPTLAHRRSQKDIVTFFEENRNSDTVALVYFNKMQYSGDFYSEGHAIVIKKNDYAQLDSVLRNAERNFYVVDDDDLGDFPSDENHLEFKGVFGDYTVFADPLR